RISHHRLPPRAVPGALVAPPRSTMQPAAPVQPQSPQPEKDQASSPARHSPLVGRTVVSSTPARPWILFSMARSRVKAVAGAVPPGPARPGPLEQPYPAEAHRLRGACNRGRFPPGTEKRTKRASQFWFHGSLLFLLFVKGSGAG